MLNRVIILLLLQICSGAFTEFPLDGNHWEFQPLILRWSHNFTDIRGCVWSYIGGIHVTDFTFISYGTKEGLEIKILGWELLDASNPCAGVILKKNCTVSDAGRYEMRVAAQSLFRSKIIYVGIINRNDRSVTLLSGLIVTKLIPGRHDNRIVYLDSDEQCTVILNDKYPDDTCTTVHRIGRNQSETICNKTIKMNLEDDVTQIKIIVPLDVVDSEKFIFSVQKEGQAEIPEDDRPTETGIITRVAIGVAVPLIIMIAISCVFVFSNKSRHKIKHLWQRSRGDNGAKSRHQTDEESTCTKTAFPDKEPQLEVQTFKSLPQEEDPEAGLLSSTEEDNPEVDRDFNQGKAMKLPNDDDFQAMDGPVGKTPDTGQSKDNQTSNSNDKQLEVKTSKSLAQEKDPEAGLLPSTEETNPEVDLDFNHGIATIPTKDDDFQNESPSLAMDGPVGKKPDKRQSKDKQTSKSNDGQLEQQGSKRLDQETNAKGLSTSIEERCHNVVPDSYQRKDTLPEKNTHSSLVVDGPFRTKLDRTRSDDKQTPNSKTSPDNTHVAQIHCSPTEDYHEVDLGARSNLDVNKEGNRDREMISTIDALVIQLLEARDVLVQPHTSVQQQEVIYRATSNSTDTLNEDRRTSCRRMSDSQILPLPTEQH